MNEDWRLVNNARHPLGAGNSELVDHTGRGIHFDFVKLLPDAWSSRLRERQSTFGLDVRVEDLKGGHPSEPCHPLAVRTHACTSYLRCGCFIESILTCCHCCTSREPFDIPLPGGPQGFIEVIDVEEQSALGRCKEPEIQEVCVPACLHLDAGHRCR